MQVHAYAGLSFYGVTPLYVATGTSGLKNLYTDKQGKKHRGVSQAEYLNLLRVNLIPSIRQVFAKSMFKQSFIFQQDNARPHIGSGVELFLTSEGIPLLKWPGNSPDLSPIENAWGIVQ